MRISNIVCVLFIFFTDMSHLNGNTKNIYLFPGQGADKRLFSKLTFDSTFKVNYISYPIPEKNETLEHYSERFISQIDTTRKFILIGVSMGGMICTELHDKVNPEKTILISSAKSCGELPKKYTIHSKLRLNRIIPGEVLKFFAQILAPLVEKDRIDEKAICNDMLKSKHPLYMKRSIDMIVNWKRNSYSSTIIHIHGSNDKTIPLKNVKADYIIKKGSHMMVLTQPDEINKLLLEIFYMTR